MSPVRGLLLIAFSVIGPAAASEMKLLTVLQDPAGSINNFGMHVATGCSMRLYVSDYAWCRISGRSVSVLGDYVLVGLRSFGAGSGAADLFKISHENPPKFSLVQRLLPDEVDVNSEFGFRVALGPGFAVVGCPSCTNAGASASGAVYIFELAVENLGGAEQWALAQRLHLDEPQADAKFGDAVAVSGEALLIAAPGDSSSSYESGKVYAYERVEGKWKLSASIQPSSVAIGDKFGTALAASGPYFIASIDSAKRKPGRSFVFRQDVGKKWHETAELVPDSSVFNDEFGHSVAIGHSTHTGTVALVGAAGIGTKAAIRHGACFLFSQKSLSEEWQQTALINAPAGDSRFGHVLAMHGDAAIIGSKKPVGPAVHSLQFTASREWSLLPVDPMASHIEVLGRSLLAMTDRWAVIGDPEHGRVFVLSHPNAPLAQTVAPLPPLPIATPSLVETVPRLPTYAPIPPLPTHAPQPVGDAPTICIDADAQCGGWARLGECEVNVAFMRSTCMVSCFVCGGTDFTQLDMPIEDSHLEVAHSSDSAASNRVTVIWLVVACIASSLIFWALGVALGWLLRVKQQSRTPVTNHTPVQKPTVEDSVLPLTPGTPIVTPTRKEAPPAMGTRVELQQSGVTQAPGTAEKSLVHDRIKVEKTQKDDSKLAQKMFMAEALGSNPGCISNFHAFEKEDASTSDNSPTLTSQAPTRPSSSRPSDERQPSSVLHSSPSEADVTAVSITPLPSLSSDHRSWRRRNIGRSQAASTAETAATLKVRVRATRAEEHSGAEKAASLPELSYTNVLGALRTMGYSSEEFSIHYIIAACEATPSREARPERAKPLLTDADVKRAVQVGNPPLLHVEVRRRHQTSTRAKPKRKLVLVAMCRGVSHKTAMLESALTREAVYSWIEETFQVAMPRVVFTKANGTHHSLSTESGFEDWTQMPTVERESSTKDPTGAVIIERLMPLLTVSVKRRSAQPSPAKTPTIEDPVT
jgi:hypothetical protein